MLSRWLLKKAMQRGAAIERKATVRFLHQGEWGEVADRNAEAFAFWIKRGDHHTAGEDAWAAPRLAQLGAQVYAALFTAATVLIVMEGLAGALTRSPA